MNLASRLDSLTGKLGRPLVVSADFAAAAAGTAFDDLGTFQLKAIAAPQRVFGAP